MITAQNYSHSANYRELVLTIDSLGTVTAPRGIKAVDISPVVVTTVDPRDRIVLDGFRKMNIAFAFVEWLMLMTGDDSVNRIAYYAKNMKKFSSDGKSVDGAYGPRFFPHFNEMTERLRDDMYTRQAVINIYKSSDMVAVNVPCTLSVQAKYDTKGLSWFTSMRSNDVVWGFTYDLFMWTMTQEFLAARLGMPLGCYYHMTNSLHLYTERDGKMVEQMREDGYPEKESRRPMLPMPMTSDSTIAAMNAIERMIQTGSLGRALFIVEDLPQYWQNWCHVLAAWTLHKEGKSVEAQIEQITDPALYEASLILMPHSYE